MKLKIDHKTVYTYSKPVFIEPHLLFLIPQQRPHLKPTSFNINIYPTSSGLGRRIDAENNSYYQCWFNDKISKLTIETSLMVEANPLNQFDFLIKDLRDENTAKALQLYLSFEGNLISNDIKEYVNTIYEEQATGISFLGALNETIYGDMKHTLRYEPELLTPSQCLNSKSGSCRDLSWFMINALRFKGIPARFVSGYSYNPEIVGHELHAWVEAWLDGAGWIGLDPSAGMFITETYVPLAVSFHPSNTLPVQGSFRGDAKSNLETAVRVTGRN